MAEDLGSVLQHEIGIPLTAAQKLVEAGGSILISGLNLLKHGLGQRKAPLRISGPFLSCHLIHLAPGTGQRDAQLRGQLSADFHVCVILDRCH